MGEIHDLILTHGRQGALDLGGFDRPVIDAADRFLFSDNTETSYLFSGWCQAALPHRRFVGDADGRPWSYKSPNCSLLVQSLTRDRGGVHDRPGVPYGSRARLIMYFLQTAAVRRKSRDVPLGRNLNQWLRKLGMPVGGKSYRLIQDQCERLAYCHISFSFFKGDQTLLVHQPLIDTSMFRDEIGGRFIGEARLSERYYQQLIDHPVPLPELAITILANNSMALDVYAWLAYRLWILDCEIMLPWKLLYAQFGAGFQRSDNFAAHFKNALNLALACYPDAEVSCRPEGLVLHKSAPPVRRTVVQGHRI